MPRELPLPVPQRDFPSPGIPSQNCLLSFSFGRIIQPERWKKAWEVLVCRHPILRSSLSRGMRSLLEFDHLEASWSEPDWSSLSPGEVAEKWNELREEEREAPFEPGSAPFWRMHLIALPGGSHHLLCTIAPILLDQASAGEMLLEWVQLYERLPDGAQAAVWPSTASPSAAVGAVELPEQHGLSAASQLAVPSPEAIDPFALFRTPSDLPGLEIFSRQLPAETAKALSRLREECGASRDAFLAALWGYWLASQTPSGEALLCARFDLRSLLPVEFEEVLSRFETRLPWLARPSSFDRPPAEALPALCGELASLGNDLFAEWHGPASLLSSRHGIPCVPATDAAWDAAELNDLLHTAMPSWLGSDARWEEVLRVPLALRATGDVRVNLSLHADRAFLPPPAARAIFERFSEFLETLCEEPSLSPRRAVDLTPEFPEFRLVADAPQGIPLDEALRHGGDRPAVLFGQETTSFADLLRFSNQTIRHLRRQKSLNEKRLLLAMRPSPWMVIAIAALVRDGIETLAVSPADLPDELDAFLLEHNIGLALCDASCESLFESMEFKCVALDSSWEKIAALPDNEPGNRKLPASGACLSFLENGVLRQTPLCVLRDCLAGNVALHALSAEDRFLLHGECGSLSTFEEILAALTSGATLVLPEADIFATRSAFHEIIETSGVSALSLDPLRWADYVHFLAELKLAAPAPLRHLLLESGRIGKKVADAWVAASPNVLTTLFHSVAGSRSLAFHAPWGAAFAEEGHGGAIPLGYCPSSLVAVAIGKNGLPMPAGLPGKLSLLPGEELAEVLPSIDFPIEELACFSGQDGVWRATRFPGLPENLPFPLLARLESAFLAHPDVFDVLLAESHPGEGKLRAWILPLDSQGSFPSGLPRLVRERLGTAWELSEAALIFKYPATANRLSAIEDLPPVQPVSLLEQAPSARSTSQARHELPASGVPSFRLTPLTSESASGKPLLVVCDENANSSLAQKIAAVFADTRRVAVFHPETSHSSDPREVAEEAVRLFTQNSPAILVGSGNSAWNAARAALSLEKIGHPAPSVFLLAPSVNPSHAAPSPAGFFRDALALFGGKKAASNSRRASSSRAFRCALPVHVLVDGQPDPALASYFPSADFFDADLSSEETCAKVLQRMLDQPPKGGGDPSTGAAADAAD